MPSPQIHNYTPYNTVNACLTLKYKHTSPPHLLSCYGADRLALVEVSDKGRNEGTVMEEEGCQGQQRERGGKRREREGRKGERERERERERARESYSLGKFVTEVDKVLSCRRHCFSQQRNSVANVGSNGRHIGT